MSTDFRVNRIATLTADTPAALEGIKAIRAGAGLAYKLARTVFSDVSKGVNYEVDCGGGVSAVTDRQNATPTQYVGDSTNGTDGTAAFNVASLSLKARYNARQYNGAVHTLTLASGGTGYEANDILTLVQTGGTGCTIKVLTVDAGAIVTWSVLTAGHGYFVASALATTGHTADATFNVTKVGANVTSASQLTYASGYALASGELYKVKVDGVLQTVTTDYTVSSQDIIFVSTAAKRPAHGARVEIFALSNPAALTNEVVTVTVDGAVKAAGGTDYTLADGVVTFAAGKVPLAGERIAIFFRIPGTVEFTYTADAGDVNCSDAGTLIVYVDEVAATVTTDYVAADGVVTFETASIPAADAVVRIAWVYANWDTAVVADVGFPSRVLGAEEDMRVYIDNVLGVEDTDYEVDALINSMVHFLKGGVTTLTLASGGTSYEVDDVITLVQAGASGCTIKVLTVNAGAIVTWEILTPGTGYSVANTLATTGHTTDATFNITVIAPGLPADAVVEIKYASAVSATVIAGGEVFFDVLKLNVPVWDEIIADGTKIVEVM